MTGTVSNSFFTVWKYLEEKKTILAISSQFFTNSKVELKYCDFPFAFEKDGSMVSGLSKYEAPYKKVITFYMFCKINNLSSKRITIQDINSGIRFGDKVILVHPVIFRGIFDKKLNRQALPRLIEPGEQILYFIQIGWPVGQRVLDELKLCCPNPNSSSLVDIYSCLKRSGIDLNYEADGITPRTLCIEVETADGQTFRQEQKLFDIAVY